MAKHYPDGRPDLVLGQRVSFTHIAKPDHTEIGRYSSRRTMGRKALLKDGAKVEGVFVGWRNAQEGVTRYGDEDGPQFTVEERPLVALVAYDVRKNPVMVHFTDVTPLTSLEGERHNAKREAVAEVGERIRDKVRMGDNSSSEAAAGETVVAEYLAELGEWEQ